MMDLIVEGQVYDCVNAVNYKKRRVDFFIIR